MLFFLVAFKLIWFFAFNGVLYSNAKILQINRHFFNLNNPTSPIVKKKLILLLAISISQICVCPENNSHKDDKKISPRTDKSIWNDEQYG